MSRGICDEASPPGSATGGRLAKRSTVQCYCTLYRMNRRPPIVGSTVPPRENVNTDGVGVPHQCSRADCRLLRGGLDRRCLTLLACKRFATCARSFSNPSRRRRKIFSRSGDSVSDHFVGLEHLGALGEWLLAWTPFPADFWRLFFFFSPLFFRVPTEFTFVGGDAARG